MGVRGLNALASKVQAAKAWLNSVFEKLKERFSEYLEGKGRGRLQRCNGVRSRFCGRQRAWTLGWSH